MVPVFCCSPKGFFYRKDRSALQFADPIPGLEHEFAEVNGVRWAAAVPTEGLQRDTAFPCRVGPFVLQVIGRHGRMRSWIKHWRAMLLKAVQTADHVAALLGAQAAHRGGREVSWPPKAADAVRARLPGALGHVVEADAGLFLRGRTLSD